MSAPVMCLLLPWPSRNVPLPLFTASRAARSIIGQVPCGFLASRRQRAGGSLRLGKEGRRARSPVSGPRATGHGDGLLDAAGCAPGLDVRVVSLERRALGPDPGDAVEVVPRRR